jgi:DNA invertase Pin-like site-specific DNA recombinase
MTTAVGYVRISKLDQDTTSPQRQRRAITKWCKDRGITLRECYEDLDLSAFRQGVKRPGFDRMLANLDGTDFVVTWRIDRLARSVSGFSRLLEALEAAKVKLATTDGAVDTSTAQGRFTVNLAANLAELESATTGERSRAMVQFKRDQGEPLGRVPYGWKRVGKHYEPDPKAQVKLREAAEMYVRGGTFNGIAKELGFSAAGPISRMLHSPRVAEVLPSDLAGQLAEAILARKGERVPTSRQSLLGGIAQCAECGSTMVASSTRANRRGKWFSYSCRACGRVAISAPWLDTYVTDQVLEAVDSGELLKALKRRKPIARTRKASEVEARMALLDEQFTSGKVTAERFKRMNASLIEELAKATKVERGNGHELPAELARDLRATWPRLTVPERRRVIQAVLAKVSIAKAKSRGGVRIDPSRVELVWR